MIHNIYALLVTSMFKLESNHDKDNSNKNVKYIIQYLYKYCSYFLNQTSLYPRTMPPSQQHRPSPPFTSDSSATVRALRAHTLATPQRKFIATLQSLRRSTTPSPCPRENLVQIAVQNRTRLCFSGKSYACDAAALHNFDTRATRARALFTPSPRAHHTTLGARR